MARVHTVLRAQQRYATKPVLNDDGTPQTVTLTGRDGQPLTTKRGGTRTRALTVRDTTKPLPMPRCDYPGCNITGGTIEPGQSYRWVEPKMGPKRHRHTDHPSWQPWDLTSAMWAQIAQVVDTAEHALDAWDSEDASDVAAILQEAADEARTLAEQRTEAADAMEDGFGHETEASANLREHADNIEQWADDLESWSADEDAPDASDYTLDDEGNDLDNPDDHDESERVNDAGENLADALDSWRESVRDSARDALNETPEV